ncbi:MAG: iron-sulfur cluster assembly protein [Ignavibacteriales bacterium]|nr:iron-sulfur cluster assembly protein [Ignavibacteriales bacterium]
MEENLASQGEPQQAPVFEPAEVQVGSRVVTAQTSLEAMMWDALKQCYDPEIPVNIVDLGLVYDLKIDDEIPGEANVFVTMTLTAPGCGMGPMIAADVKRRAQTVQGVSNVRVELVFTPTWNPAMMSEAARLMLNFG